MKRILSLLLLAPLAVLATAEPSEKNRPNILFIMVDEMKWNVMGCAGHEVVKTPHLDQLAREGTRFATAYTVVPTCTPSRYSFFKGRYAHVHGSTDNSTPPRDPQVMLPSILKHAGYQTAISGKLHFIHPANIDYGFDSFWSYKDEGPGKLPSWLEYIEEKHGKGAQKKSLQTQPFPDDPLGKDLGKLKYPTADSQTSWITARALAFIAQRDKAKPLFLCVSYLDPHSLSHPCEPYWSMYQNEYNPAKIPLPPTFKQDPSKPLATDDNRHKVNDPKIVKAMTATYCAMVMMVADNVGRLLAQFRKQDLAENTLIVFTADHGNMIGDLNRWFKGAMYEGSTRIPMLMKVTAASPFAAQFNCCAVVTNIVENIDLMPTLCEMVGVPLPAPGIQGRSLTGLVAGKASDRENRAFAERGSSMVRTAQYKFIKNEKKKSSGDFELYNLTMDPQETKNLAADPAYAETVKKLAAQLDAWQKDSPPVPSIDGVVPEPKSGAPDRQKATKAKKKLNDADKGE